VIDGLYKKIASIQGVFESALIAPLMTYADVQPTIEEQLAKGFDAAIEFIRYYDQNSLYLDEKTCELIDTFNGKLKEMWRKDVIDHFHESYPGIGQANQYFEVKIFKEDVRRILKEDLPPIKSQITKKMQMMLGLNQNGNT
jgi:hypothetical protein